MSLEQAVKGIPGLEDAYRRGLRALPDIDRNRISARPSRRLAGSVFIEEALARLSRFQNENLWDYVIAWNAIRQDEVLHWVEVHPADRIHAIVEVAAKLEWLLGWLKGDGGTLQSYERRIAWISSGKSAFQQNAPQLKKLALKGLYFAGRRYKISD